MPKPVHAERMHPADWSGHIRNCEWQIYEGVMDAAAAARIPFALGGSFALATYTGTWTVDLPGAIGALKRCGYDGTITLEVFSRDKHYLAYSRDVLRKLWDRR